MPAPARRRSLVVAGREEVPAGASRRLEARGVQVLGCDHQPVTRRLTDEHTCRRTGRAGWFQQSTQMGYVGLQRADGLGWRLLAPQLVNQPVETHDTVRGHQQDRQDRALLGPTQHQRSLVGKHLERSKDLELQRPPPRSARQRGPVPRMCRRSMMTRATNAVQAASARPWWDGTGRSGRRDGWSYVGAVSTPSAEWARPDSVRAQLARRGFADPQTATELLQELGVEDAGAPLVASLADAADPDLALRSLSRIAAALDEIARPAFLTALREHTRLRGRLLPVLGASTALGDHLARHPHHWRDLAAAELTAASPEALRNDLLRSVGADPAAPSPVAEGDGAAVLDSLRVAYRRHLLGLAARDLAEGARGRRRGRASSPTSPARRSRPGWPSREPSCRPAPAPCRLAVIGHGQVRRPRAQLRERRRRRLRRRAVRAEARDEAEAATAAPRTATRRRR